ncbi:MAG: DUF4091 domain-containing protein [Clostridiales bacterium]|nr:DUF4091 domain-containing protein [Clostridiales bacterium]
MKDFKLKKVSCMEKVFAAKEPSGEGSPAKLTAFRGENVSFQIAYYWTGEAKGRGQAEIISPIKDRVHVRMVELVPCLYPCHPERDNDYAVTEPGLYPDLLSEIPEAGFPMVRGNWGSLWVDIDVNEEMPAGEYPVEILLSVEGGQEKVEVTCEVLDAVLPKLPVPHTEWFHSDCLANYYDVEVFSEKHWEIVENFVKTAVKRGQNMLLTPVFTPPLDTAVGGERRTVQLVDVKAEGDVYTFGFEKFERWVEMAKRSGIEYFEISHLFSQWGAAAAPKIMGEKDGKTVKLFGWDTVASGEEYSDFLHQFLNALKPELAKLGIEKKTYFHVSDEPQMSQLESYKAARNVVAKDLEGYTVFDALSDYEFYKEGLVAEPVCAVNHIGPFIENRPEKLWGYYCTAQWKDVSNRFIALQGYRTRIIGTQMYKYQLDGFLHWGYNFYNCQCSLYPIDPYRVTDADGAFPSGDAFLVYPGADGKPVESLRIMHMDEAMSDLRAMNYLESLVGRDAVMKCIESCPAEGVTFDKYPRNFTYLTACRERINEAVKEALLGK